MLYITCLLLEIDRDTKSILKTYLFYYIYIGKYCNERQNGRINCKTKILFFKFCGIIDFYL